MQLLCKAWCCLQKQGVILFTNTFTMKNFLSELELLTLTQQDGRFLAKRRSNVSYASASFVFAFGVYAFIISNESGNFESIESVIIPVIFVVACIALMFRIFIRPVTRKRRPIEKKIKRVRGMVKLNLEAIKKANQDFLTHHSATNRITIKSARFDQDNLDDPNYNLPQLTSFGFKAIYYRRNHKTISMYFYKSQRSSDIHFDVIHLEVDMDSWPTMYTHGEKIKSPDGDGYEWKFWDTATKNYLFSVERYGELTTKQDEPRMPE